MRGHAIAAPRPKESIIPSDIDSISLRAALRQQLRSDQLFGLTVVPISRDTLDHTAAESGLRRANPSPGHASSAPTPGLSTTEKTERLSLLDNSQVKGCRKCSLCETRTQTVFGQGNPDARLVFVGEAPGFEEDRQGLAFVGKAGQLLTRMIAAMGLTREDVYICNVLKCRPPNNRDPSADEILACSPYLREQLATIRPQVLVALGSPAAKTLLNTAESIGRLRGRFHDYYASGATGVGNAIPLMPTYHPAYLLRNPADKGKTWDDLQQVMRFLELPIPPRSSG